MITLRGVYQRSVNDAELPHSLLRQRRAEAVRAAVREIWGDELPPSQDPELTALIDALSTDDDLGRRRGLVVQADGLTVTALRALLDASPPAARDRLLATVPQDLLLRVLAPVGN